MSGWKTALAVILLMAGIFGVTVISQLSPKPKGSAGGGSTLLPPLSYTVTEYQYDPEAEPDYYYNRWFNGFLEIGTGGEHGPRNWVGFVLMNKRPTPAYLSPAQNCACAGARAATLPHEKIDAFASLAACGGLLGIHGVPNLIAPCAWAEHELKLSWFVFDLKDYKRSFCVPGTEEPTRPTWVLIDFDFTATQEKPPTTISATFAVVDERNELLLNVPLTFKVTHAVREPFEIWPRQLNVGEFPAGVEPRTFEIYAFSMTRALDRLPPPAVALANDYGTVEVAEPVPLSSNECYELASRISEDYKGRVRVLGGYRYRVTVHRQGAGQLANVGAFAKELHFGSNLTPRSFRAELKGTVVGAVRLAEGDKIDLGSYDASRPLRKEIRLIAERDDLDLALIPERCGPKFIDYQLSPPQRSYGSTTWSLILTIPEQQGRQPSWKDEVVLRSQGAEAEIYRIPILGRGR